MNRNMEKVRSCYEAYRDNDVVAVRRALEEGFVVDSCDWFNDTLLHVSARCGHTEIVSLLLEHKADVNVQNWYGCTPLHESARCGYTEIVSLLLEHKADVNVQNKYGCTPLHESAVCGHTEIVSLLLEHKADVNVQNKDGCTPLHWSASFGYKEIVSLLLATMDNVNVKDNNGRTPLHNSADRGHKEIVSMLLSKNADVNVQDNDGMTPLHRSAWSGHTETVSLLLANKTDVNVKCNEGFTPIDYASNTEVVNVLLQHGAVPDKQGRRSSSFILCSQITTTTSSFKVAEIPGFEYRNYSSASTSFIHTQTIEIKDEVTSTNRNDETTSDPALIYENTDQDKIPDPQTLSTLEHGQVLASAIAGDIQQAVTNQVKQFPGIISSQPSISTNVSTSQQTEATVVNINITFNVNVNEMNIADTRDVKVQNAQIKKPACVAYNSSIQVVNSSRGHAQMMRQKNKRRKRFK